MKNHDFQTEYPEKNMRLIGQVRLVRHLMSVAMLFSAKY